MSKFNRHTTDQKKAILAEVKNIIKNHPVFPGDTLSPNTANQCFHLGWIKRDKDFNWVPTEKCPFSIVGTN